jgi:hypothetical protein
MSTGRFWMPVFDLAKQHKSPQMRECRKKITYIAQNKRHVIPLERAHVLQRRYDLLNLSIERTLLIPSQRSAQLLRPGVKNRSERCQIRLVVDIGELGFAYLRGQMQQRALHAHLSIEIRV